VDPIIASAFRIGPHDRIATAGSCFAQHISRTLSKLGFNYLVTEAAPATPGAADENYGVFPARFGNIYTSRQLLQLLRRAYGLFEPADSEWPSREGAFIDPFRPRIQRSGFTTVALLQQDRESHLAAVREMFETCDVFVFTLGLTESWQAKADGAVFPLPRGAVCEELDPDDYVFHNLEAAEVEADLLAFTDMLRDVNPSVRMLLTVSPVPLVATYENQHVLAATTYSKSVLRVAAEQVSKRRPGIGYFPSYEIITGPQARGRFYEEDLREISREGVDHVMSIFARHYLDSKHPESTDEDAKRGPSGGAKAMSASEWDDVVCDEIVLGAAG
jgi:hypothetical protein